MIPNNTLDERRDVLLSYLDDKGFSVLYARYAEPEGYIVVCTLTDDRGAVLYQEDVMLLAEHRHTNELTDTAKRNIELIFKSLDKATAEQEISQYLHHGLLSLSHSTMKPNSG